VQILGCARALWLGVPLMLSSTLVVVATTPQGARGEPTTTAVALASGRDTFRQFCAPCHGVDGRGHGPIAAILTTPPTDLTTMKRRNMGVFPLATFEAMITGASHLATAAHGSEQMPIWGPTFSAIDGNPTLARARVANLAAYMESLQQ